MATERHTPASVVPFHDQIREGRIDHLVVQLRSIDGGLNLKVRNKLEQFEDSTLDLIEAAAEWNANLSTPSEYFMNNVLLTRTERTICEAAFYCTRTSGDFDSHEVCENTTGLHLLDRYKEQDKLEELTGTELEIATAFINITAALKNNSDGRQLSFIEYEGTEAAWYIHDTELQDFIAAHHQHADDIIGYIGERRSANTEELRDYLTNGTILKTGIL